MIEGRGLVTPHPVTLAVGCTEQRYLHSIVRERASRRSYARRQDLWGRGLTSGKQVRCLGWVPKDELGALTGTVGEYALFTYLANEFGSKNVGWDPRPAKFGDGGRDVEIFGQRIQVKTRRNPYGKVLVRRVNHRGGQIEPLNFDILVGCEWSLTDRVSLIGWCQRHRLFDSNFARSRFDHYNLEIFDHLLLPMCRLVDHLLVRQSA
jgi:hypothetical protein